MKAKDETIKDRYCKIKEVDAFPEPEEGQESELTVNENAATKLKDDMTEAIAEVSDRINIYNIQTD